MNISGHKCLRPQEKSANGLAFGDAFISDLALHDVSENKRSIGELSYKQIHPQTQFKNTVTHIKTIQLNGIYCGTSVIWRALVTTVGVVPNVIKTYERTSRLRS